MSIRNVLGISVFGLACVVITACGDGSGSCVGTGGVLLSPTCNEGWSSSECADWQSQGVNSATWTHSNSSCVDQGYTENCSPNVYRLPGSC